MSVWTNNELDRIAAADELELASATRDGTLRKPVTIWVVRDGDDLYVRSFTGAPADGSAACKSGMRATSAPAGSRRTCSSSRPMRETTRSTPPTGRSTSATAPATSTRWSPPKREQQRSGSCPTHSRSSPPPSRERRMHDARRTTPVLLRPRMSGPKMSLLARVRRLLRGSINSSVPTLRSHISSGWTAKARSPKLTFLGTGLGTGSRFLGEAQGTSRKGAAGRRTSRVNGFLARGRLARACLNTGSSWMPAFGLRRP